MIPAYLNPRDGTSTVKVLTGYGLASFTPNGGAFGRGVSFANGFPDGTSNTVLFGERLMICGDIPNRWFSAGPDGMVFGAVPEPMNFGVGDPAQCDPDRVCTVTWGILVAMADGSTREVPRDVAMNNWAQACGPDDGDKLGDDW